MLKLFLLIVLFFVFAMTMEKLFHMSYSLEQLVYQLKSDIGLVLKALTSKPIVRHQFNLQLAQELKNVARPYTNIAFDIDVGASFNSGTPFVGIHFIPNNKFEVNELNEITGLLLLKFRRYLFVNGLHWRTFACFSSGHDFTNIYLYYAEVPEDIENFLYRYRMTIREKVAPDYGVLQDDELNKELENVN